MKKCFLLFCVFFAVALETRANPFTVDSFTTSPPDEVGVGCWFGTKGGIDKGEYFYSAGTTDTSYVSINNTLRAFVLDEKASKKLPKGYSVYRNGEYVIELYEKVVGQTDGGASYKVTMTVKNKKGEKVVKHLVGSCGC